MDEDLINIDEIEEIKDSVSYGITEFPDKKNENDGKRGQDKTVRNKKEKLPPTDSLVTDNLVESFALLSSMLDEAKNTKKNLEKIHESIVDLLKVVTELRDVSEEFSKVNQIVKEINNNAEYTKKIQNIPIQKQNEEEKLTPFELIITLLILFFGKVLVIFPSFFIVILFSLNSFLPLLLNF